MFFMMTGDLTFSIASTLATFTDCGSAVGAGVGSETSAFMLGVSTWTSTSTSGGCSMSGGGSISSSFDSSSVAWTMSTLIASRRVLPTAVTTNRTTMAIRGSRIAARGAT